MIVAAHQPAYLPWLGYFDKVSRADIFVFLDTVQFEKNSFINRNRIKTPRGAEWLTAPVQMKGHIGRSLLETKFDDRSRWRDTHVRTLRMNYARAAMFASRFPRLESLLLAAGSLLAEACWEHLQFWLVELAIQTEVVRASDLGLTSTKSDLILDVCLRYGASTYLSGALGRQYLDEGAFADHGVDIVYQDFSCPVYPQLWGDFVPNLSVVDWYLNSAKPALVQGDEQ